MVACQLFNLAPPPELAALTRRAGRCRRAAAAPLHLMLCSGHHLMLSTRPLSTSCRLQRLHYAVYAGGECPGGLPDAWQPGAGQQGGSSSGGGGGGLRWLALEERLLHASRGWLEGAGGAGLDELHVKWTPWPDMRLPGGRDFGQPRWAWFWRWAAKHTALHALTFDVGGDDVPQPAGWEDARAALAAARPGLAVSMSDFAQLLPGPL